MENALINLAVELNCPIDIMKSAWEQNLRIREEKDWNNIPWATNKGDKNAT